MKNCFKFASFIVINIFNKRVVAIKCRFKHHMKFYCRELPSNCRLHACTYGPDISFSLIHSKRNPLLRLKNILLSVDFFLVVIVV